MELVVYTGRYPNVCSGTLVLRHEGTTYVFNGRLVGSRLEEKGGLDQFWSPSKGVWTVHESALPEALQSYADDIRRIFEEKMPHGCCGGCE